MYKNLSLVYDRLMDVDYTTYTKIINEELINRKDLKILDLGCGSGNLIKTLKNYGDVYGVDSSVEMLALAKNKEPDTHYFNIDLLEIKNIGEKFDLIISAFDVFNYLDDICEVKKAFQEVYNCLNSNGKFIFDMHTPKKIKYFLNNQPFVYEDEEISYLWFTYATENYLEVESEITFFVKQKNDFYKRYFEYQKQRTYEIEEILNILSELGFKTKKYYCDFDEKNLDYNNSDRIIFILEKK